MTAPHRSRYHAPVIAEPHPTDANALMAQLAARPEDQALREQAARQLMAESRPAEAVRLLTDGLILLNAHENGAMPCMCRRCLQPELAEALVDESRFARDFTVSRGRVLFFWMPEDLRADQARVRRAVHDDLNRRLR